MNKILRSINNLLTQLVSGGVVFLIGVIFIMSLFGLLNGPTEAESDLNSYESVSVQIERIEAMNQCNSRREVRRQLSDDTPTEDILFYTSDSEKYYLDVFRPEIVDAILADVGIKSDLRNILFENECDEYQIAYQDGISSDTPLELEIFFEYENKIVAVSDLEGNFYYSLEDYLSGEKFLNWIGLGVSSVVIILFLLKLKKES